MIREKNNTTNNDNNTLNLSLAKNESTFALTQTEMNLISDNENKIRNKKDDEKYRNYHYFNRFHYSVTSGRKEPTYFK